jgi:uncharacterized membrane protein (UPF0127 family)
MKSLFAAAACVVWFASGCSRTPEEPSRPTTASNSTSAAPLRAATCPPDPDGIPMLPVHTLSIRENSVQFACELVWKPEDTERGLMYRTQMADDHGMLFKLPRRVQRFWMRNTCISLDMLFIDTDGTIAGILERVPNLNDDSRSIGKPTTYVLELAAGAASKYGLQAGQHLEIPAEIRDLKVPDSQ